MATQELPKQGLIGRWLKSPHYKGLAYEIEKLLPNVVAAAQVEEQTITKLLEAYGIHETHGGNAAALLMIITTLAGKSTAAEIQHGQAGCLLTLTSWLGLDGTSVTAALEASAARHFQNAYEREIANCPIDDLRKAAVLEFGRSMNLPLERLNALINSITGPIIQARLAAILSDTMMSPDEEQGLHRLADDLGVKLQISDPETARVLSLARTRWEISAGHLPMADSPLMLKRGEICHAAVAASAYEERTRTVRTNYHGISTHVRIMKGIYYNAGSYRAGTTKETFSYPLGDGHLVVTDKRVLFSSAQKNMAFSLESIIDWKLYSDGIEIRRSTGKPITFIFGKGNGLFLEIIIAARKKFIG